MGLFRALVIAAYVIAVITAYLTDDFYVTRSEIHPAVCYIPTSENGE